MDIIIQSLGFTAGADLEEFVRQKLKKFDKEINIIRANVTLHTGPHSNPNWHYCEIRLEIPGNDIFVGRNNDTFEKAVLDAVHTLQTKIHKAREKQLDRKHGSPP